MKHKLERNNEFGFFGCFKKCPVCGESVLCTPEKDSRPETHDKKCSDYEKGMNAIKRIKNR